MQRNFDQRRKTLWAILGVAVLLRLAAAIYLGDQVVSLPGTADQVSYHALAVRVLEGHGFTFDQPWWPVTAAGAPTAHWSFLYTFYLTGVYAIFGIHPLAARLMQVVIVGVLQPYLAYRLANRIFSVSSRPHSKHGQWIGLTAAAITAIYVYFVYYATALMTEPFYITAVLGALYLAMQLVDKIDTKGTKAIWRPQPLTLGLGLCLAAAVLLRQMFLLFVPLLVLWLLIAAYRRSRLPQMLWQIVSMGSIIILAILPFTVYNTVRFDRLVLLNTNAGYALYFANHPIYGTQFVDILPQEMGSYQALIPEELRHLDEAALDQALLGESIRIIGADPVRYLLLSASRIPSYFKFWPSADSSTISNIARVSSFGLFLGFMVYGLLLSFIRRPSPAIWLLYLFMGFYTGIHLLVWTLIRYRLPVDAVLILFAAYGLVDLVTRIRSRAIR